MGACRHINPSQKEQKALEQLKHREGIVITNAEKGSTVVILDVKVYIKEYERQLHNTEHLGHLEHDPTTENNAKVNKAITRFKGDKLISSTVSN